MRAATSVTVCTQSMSAFRGSDSAKIALIAGRSARAIGSSSPTMAQSKASLSRATLPPTELNTVRRLTCAASAIPSIVVAA